MILDLRYRGELNSELSDIFNNIAYRMRGPFTDFVSEISQPLRDNIHWWVEGPASRNTLVSPLFHYYCSLFLIEELFHKNEINISKIVVDSRAFKAVAQQLLKRHEKKNVKIKFALSGINLLKRWVIKYIFIYYIIIKRAFQIWCARRTAVNKKIFPKRPLTLIDTFLFPEFLKKDHYYPGLWETLDRDQRKDIYFVPTLSMLPAKTFLSIYRRIRDSEKNYLVKEDFLKLRELLIGFKHYFKSKKIPFKQCHVLETDISCIIEEELRSLRGFSYAIDSLLNFYFVKRLKEEGIKVRLAVDWFENQVLDKGWNLGFNTFYPEAKKIGYRGFIPSPLYLCAYPSQIEKEIKCIPSTIFVIGDGFIHDTKEFVNGLDVRSAPAFRYDHLWLKRKKSMGDNKKKYIVVALTIMPEESLHILKLIKGSIKSIRKQYLIIWIMLHPTMSEKVIKRRFKELWPDTFIIVKGSKPSDYLRKADILISGMSSICLESMALGIPVIAINHNHGLNYNTIPREIPDEMYIVCSTDGEVSLAINHFLECSEEQKEIFKKQGDKIRNNYFLPVTKDNVRAFLYLDK